MSQQVDIILRQIEHLDEAERTLLEERLQKLAETEWKREVDHARTVAFERGIEQRTIDDAVAELRYGR